MRICMWFPIERKGCWRYILIIVSRTRGRRPEIRSNPYSAKKNLIHNKFVQFHFFQYNNQSINARKNNRARGYNITIWGQFLSSHITYQFFLLNNNGITEFEITSSSLSSLPFPIFIWYSYILRMDNAPGVVKTRI